MQLCGFLKMTHACAIPPGDVSFACSQGLGALIDYVFASETLAPFARVSRCSDTLQDPRGLESDFAS
eukprot:5528234-Pyramimonas_sp.AAC.1